MNRVISATIVILLSICLTGCNSDSTPKIVAGIDACSVCNMVIDQLNQACGTVGEEGFLPFDSPGCLLRKYDELRTSGSPLPTTIYFADYTTSKLIPADSAWFLLTTHLPTVMNAQVLTFAEKANAESLSKLDDESVTDWRGYRTAHGRPDQTYRITLTDEGVEPDVISANKGELLEWIIVGIDLRSDVILHVQGYSGVGEIHVQKDGTPISIRIYADKPGAGFPIVDGSGKVLGMLKVFGAHTLDEEQM